MEFVGVFVVPSEAARVSVSAAPVMGFPSSTPPFRFSRTWNCGGQKRLGSVETSWIRTFSGLAVTTSAMLAIARRYVGKGRIGGGARSCRLVSRALDSIVYFGVKERGGNRGTETLERGAKTHCLFLSPWGRVFFFLDNLSVARA